MSRQPEPPIFYKLKVKELNSKESVTDTYIFYCPTGFTSILYRGTREGVQKIVFMLFERVSYDRGYIFSCTDHFFDTPVEDLRYYAEAARECLY